MKTLLLAAAITFGAGVCAANAQSFTFQSTATVQNAVAAPVKGGKPVQAVFIAGKSQTNWLGGKTSTNTFQCASWSSTPGSLFDSYTACTYADTNGDSASIIAGCDFTNDARTESDCWGGINGLEGPHKGKSGTMAWHGKNGSDGKTGLSAGTGQWND
jgi:hypothetical protein